MYGEKELKFKNPSTPKKAKFRFEGPWAFAVIIDFLENEISNREQKAKPSFKVRRVNVFAFYEK